MKQDFDNTSLLLPPVVKKALKLVAADQGTEAGPLLRKAATRIVKTYKNGIFFKIAAQDVDHDITDDEQQP